MPLVLSYAGCGTCKKALAWLKANQIDVTLRAIVDAPPTPGELAKWVKASGRPVRKWLNTSGLSYRALGKARIDAADEATLLQWLAADGKLVKRPVLVDGASVLVGFQPDEWARHFGR
jgi:arsenate reductase (glutaredoxin)